MLDRGNNLVTKQIEVAEMIYELDKRQLLRLWSALSSFGEIRETKDPIIQSEILRRAQLILTDFVFGLKRVPEDQSSTTPLQGGRSQTVTYDAKWERVTRTMALSLPTQIRASLSSLFQLSGGRLR